MVNSVLELKWNKNLFIEFKPKTQNRIPLWLDRILIFIEPKPISLSLVDLKPNTLVCVPLWTEFNPKFYHIGLNSPSSRRIKDRTLLRPKPLTDFPSAIYIFVQPISTSLPSFSHRIHAKFSLNLHPRTPSNLHPIFINLTEFINHIQIFKSSSHWFHRTPPPKTHFLQPNTHVQLFAI